MLPIEEEGHVDSENVTLLHTQNHGQQPRIKGRQACHEHIFINKTFHLYLSILMLVNANPSRLCWWTHIGWLPDLTYGPTNHPMSPQSMPSIPKLISTLGSSLCFFSIVRGANPWIDGPTSLQTDIITSSQEDPQ